MKKNVFNWMFAATLLLGLGITVTSCSDDDEPNDKPKTEAEKEQEAQQKASKFWSVVGQLVSVDDATEDYEGKTFEPTYGIADPTNATTRIVNTNDMKTAAQRFANLVDAKGINENTASYKWSDPEIGSMTYNKGGTAAEWATVDVDIKAVPGLQKIIYREGGEGDNGKFEGKAYYRFGDVVSRQVEVKYDQKKNNDDRGIVTEYWICVRPAFGPEGKEDSHWVCVNTVGDKNYKYYKASTGDNYWLPTALKTDKENMQNFAELLYAICNPTTWYGNVEAKHTDGKLWGFSGVPFFTDFKKANLHLHNDRFWQSVQQGWKDNMVVQKALNMEDMDVLKNIVGYDGVRLLYNGYSWWFTTSWNCELWEAVYTNGTKDEELNMHHAEYNNLEKDMKNVKFDVREMGRKTENYDGFFRDSKTRWAIRHATGKELASNKKFDVKLPIEGVKEEYRYYRDVYRVTDLTQAPEATAGPNETIENSTEDAGHYMLGDVLEDDGGDRWFCIAGSPKSDLYPNAPEQLATFVSFDNVALDLITEDNMMDVAMKLSELYALLSGSEENSGIQLTVSKLGKIGEHILNYTGVDLRKIYMVRDSVWEFTNYNTKIKYQSKSVNAFFNLAYNNPESRSQAIARVITDVTQAGTKRMSCQGISGSIQNWQYRVYKHYEVYDTTRMAGPTENERSVGMTLWQSPWASATDKMYLSDVTSQQKIDKYAAADKWVRLPQETPGGIVPGGPRTKAETTARGEDYLWKYTDFATTKTSIFNEPVLFLRVKYIVDKGIGNKPNLIATDGTKLKIVHMQDNSKFYQTRYQAFWGQNRYVFSYERPAFWLDNKYYQFAGWPKPEY